MSIDDKFLLIRNHQLFNILSEEEYEELNLVHNVLETKKGGYVYFDSQYLNKLFFIKEGYIKVGYIDDNGNEVVKEIIQQGDIFGQISLEKNNMQGEFAQAYKSDVSLCAFRIEDFEKLLKTKPHLALEFSKQVGHKLRRLENRYMNILNKDVKSRLLNFFLYLINTSLHPQGEEAATLENFLTHEEIARLIGSTRQTVTTLINEMEGAGIIRFTRQEIHFPSVKVLQKLAGVA
jgi:CRP/FNR family transcriptional regulator, cyclic AMP receptor protein